MSTNMDRYLHDIDGTALLSASEEHELALRVTAGDSAARDHLARANLRLVVRIAREYAGHGLALEDLVSEGNMGLMRAVEGFDPHVGARFSTYAAYWIKQSLRIALNKCAYVVRVPQYIGTLLAKWRRTNAVMRDELGVEPTREQIATELGLSKRQVQVLMKAQKATAATGAGNDEVDYTETLPDTRAIAPDHRLESSEDVSATLGSLEGLGDRAAMILKLRFGLDGEEPVTLQVVGERLGLTRERVRQIERESMATLRSRIAA